MKSIAPDVFKLLSKIYPDVRIALNFSNVWELLVAVQLSAQCTDKRVNIVTETLFKKYNGVLDYAKADVSELEKDVHSTGFFRNKTRNIMGAARMVLEDFGGEVPDTMEELLKLPGVARKTANVILYAFYGKNEGVTVDTHVKRISGLLGLTKEKSPVKIEKDLMKLLPQDNWGKFSLLIVQHGREVCIARRPQCEKCVLNGICPRAFKG